MLAPSCSSEKYPPAASSVFSGWTYANLLHLQVPTSDPERSLVAVYSRQVGSDLEIRLDFLSLPSPADFDLYLALDTRPGGSMALPIIGAVSELAFDCLVVIPSDIAPYALDSTLEPVAGLSPRFIDSPSLNARVIWLKKASLPGNPASLSLQVFLTPSRQSTLLQQTPAIRPTTPRPARAPLLLVFWDTLPASTPVQALRRWDGAHTGLLGGRNGVSVLLKAARSRRIPLVLADLAKPESLSALAFLDHQGQVRQAVWSGDAVLPAVSYGDPHLAEQSLALSQVALSAAGLPASNLAFGPISRPLPQSYAGFFATLEDSSHVLTWEGMRFFPLPQPVYPLKEEGAPEDEVGISGLSLSVRQALLAAALSTDPSDLVVLGGSLPASAWADSSVALAVFDIIRSYPWIWPLSKEDLLHFPAWPVSDWPLPAACTDLLCSPSPPTLVPSTANGSPVPSGITLPALMEKFRAQLAALPDGTFSRQAMTAFLNLTAPSSNGLYSGLQANALGQVGYLFYAAGWEKQPFSYSACDVDLDYDGISECILADSHWLLILRTDGARLVFAASRDAAGVSQWVGSTSQYALGLADPSEWEPALGPGADPGEIPGAFTLDLERFEPYWAETSPGSIWFTSPSGRIQKAFTLENAGWHASVASVDPVQANILLTLSPHLWPRIQPLDSWLPAPQFSQNQWGWRSSSGRSLRLELSGDAELKASSFLDSSATWLQPENPDRAYPPGHYLPFPMALLEISSSQFSVQVTSP